MQDKVYTPRSGRATRSGPVRQDKAAPRGEQKNFPKKIPDQLLQPYLRTTSRPHINGTERRAFPWKLRKEHLRLKNALLSNRRRISRNPDMI
jgi:hypothetical protein